MKFQKMVFLVTVLTIILSISAMAQDLSTYDIVKKMDAVINASKDMHQISIMILIDKDGDEKERKSEMYQKGADMRLVRFLSPADQKGISFLSLPDDVMYLYLPAFRKIRRIASHVKNESFAGTDFTYDDISTFKYEEEYNPILLETTNEFYILELTPKPNIKKDYSKLKVTIRKDNFYPVKIEHYDKGGNLWKIMERRKLEKKGNYWVSMEMEMKDLKKQHSTKSITETIELDTGLSDKVFTKRNLKKVK
jgi:outer membrane lipoprotein-sorting protein